MSGITQQKKLALMTFGISHLRKQSAELMPFYPYVPRVIQAARSSPGFTAVQPKLGALEYPRFYDENRRNAGLEVSQVLFLWENIEAVVAFSYSGIHKAALKVNHDNGWFAHKEWPAYVAWWATADEVTWKVGCDKLEHLHDHGPMPAAFNFSRSFDQQGTIYTLDNDRLRKYKDWYGKSSNVVVSAL